MIKTVLLSFSVVNLSLIVAFLLGVIFVFKKNTKPVVLAYYSLLLTVLTFFYLIGALAITLMAPFVKNFFVYPFVLFIFVPFLIGAGASYKKLKFFTGLQILVFLLSFFYSIYLYVKLL